MIHNGKYLRGRGWGGLPLLTGLQAWRGSRYQNTMDRENLLSTPQPTTYGYNWVLPPPSNSWITIVIWLYIGLNRTPKIDCYWGGQYPRLQQVTTSCSTGCWSSAATMRSPSRIPARTAGPAQAESILNDRGKGCIRILTSYFGDMPGEPSCSWTTRNP